MASLYSVIPCSRCFCAWRRRCYFAPDFLLHLFHQSVSLSFFSQFLIFKFFFFLLCQLLSMSTTPGGAETQRSRTKHIRQQFECFFVFNCVPFSLSQCTWRQGRAKWLLPTAAATRTRLRRDLRLSNVPASLVRLLAPLGPCPPVLMVSTTVCMHAATVVQLCKISVLSWLLMFSDRKVID